MSTPVGDFVFVIVVSLSSVNVDSSDDDGFTALVLIIAQSSLPVRLV